MDMADHGLHKIPTQKSSGRVFSTWLQPLIQNLIQNLVWAHAADSGVFWWIKFIWGDALLIITTGCWDFQSLSSFSGQNQCCVSTRLREVETPGPILAKSGGDSADVCLPGPRVHHHLRASSSPLHLVSNPSQARRFSQALHRLQYLTLIPFLKDLQLFSVWYKRGSFRLYLRWAQTTFPAQWQMSWDSGWQQGWEGTPASHRPGPTLTSILCLPHSHKKQKVTLMKN